MVGPIPPKSVKKRRKETLELPEKQNTKNIFITQAVTFFFFFLDKETSDKQKLEDMEPEDPPVDMPHGSAEDP
ncbi:hypothetical protein V6N13_089642 [Hibiscus sabdariffa]